MRDTDARSAVRALSGRLWNHPHYGNGGAEQQSARDGLIDNFDSAGMSGRMGPSRTCKSDPGACFEKKVKNDKTRRTICASVRKFVQPGRRRMMRLATFRGKPGQRSGCTSAARWERASGSRQLGQISGTGDAGLLPARLKDELLRCNAHPVVVATRLEAGGNPPVVERQSYGNSGSPQKPRLFISVLEVCWKPCTPNQRCGLVGRISRRKLVRLRA
jgi:hypothetical protein